MGEANGILVPEVVARQLEALLEVGNYDGAKLLLQPVQEVDAAEAIGNLPRTLQALAFRLLPKDEAIAVYEYLPVDVQQTLLERLRSGEVLELVEEMSPDAAHRCRRGSGGRGSAAAQPARRLHAGPAGDHHRPLRAG